MNKAAWVFVLLCANLPQQGWANDLLPPQIVHEPCEQYKKGEAYEVWARFYDDSPIFDPKVIYKSGNDGSWRNAPFNKEPGSEDFKAVIRAKDLKGPLYYFIEAFDENGNGPARYGSPDAPVKVTPAINPPACQQIDTLSVPITNLSSGPRPRADVTSPQTMGRAAASAAAAGQGPTQLHQPATETSACDRTDRPLYCEPLLWGSLGAVALAGAGVAAYFLYFAKDDTPSGALPSKVSLHIGAPDPTSAALGWGAP